MIDLSWRSLLVLVVAGILFMAALPKIIQPQIFHNILTAADLLPTFIQGPTAHLLPWIELVCACGLLSMRWRHGGLLVAGMLGVIYVSHAIAGLTAAPDKPCGCFGPNSGGPLTWGISMGLGLVMAVIAALVLWIERRPRAA